MTLKHHTPAVRRSILEKWGCCWCWIVLKLGMHVDPRTAATRIHSNNTNTSLFWTCANLCIFFHSPVTIPLNRIQISCSSDYSFIWRQYIIVKTWPFTPSSLFLIIYFMYLFCILHAYTEMWDSNVTINILFRADIIPLIGVLFHPSTSLIKRDKAVPSAIFITMKHTQIHSCDCVLSCT